MEDIYRDIIDSIEDGIIVVDTDRNITLFNQVSERITRISKKRAVSSCLEDVFKNNDQVLTQLVKTFETGQIFSNHDTHIIRSDGHNMPVSLVTSPIINDRGDFKGVALLIRDISRIKELEEDVRRSDSLALIGNLAAGLAHEIKNPLGGIRGAAQLLQMEMDNNAELNKYANIIIKETKRVSSLLDELLDFANPKCLNMEELNIHELLDSLIALLSQSEAGGKVEFMTIYDPSIPLLSGDEQKLIQVFLNILKNGCEAIKNEGKVEVATRFVSDFFRIEEMGGKSKMIAIDIKDNGEGIIEEDMQKIFTPLFTRKKAGTGLGLAISHRIIADHGGNIKVKSSKKEGSTFSVFLPI